MKHLILLIAAVFMHAANALAQEPPVQIWQPPRLAITGRVDQAIQLQSVRINGETSGRQAFTEIEMTFYNPNRRVLEGELQFPLLAGQSIAGFAMDVNDVLRDAVPVDKARGQQVFEEVIRTRIDPGLLEATQGNNFKLRVYPIPAEGRKRVVLRVVESLAESQGHIAYRLPVGFAERVGAFTLNVRVNGANKPNVLRNPFGDFDFRREGDSWHAENTRRDFTGTGAIEFAIAIDTAARVQTQLFEGKTYFLADVPVPQREMPRAIPDAIGLVWDSSGSGATRDHGREIALLDAYFKKMRNGYVRLTHVRDTAEAAQSFRVVDGEWNRLKEALLTTFYDGATNLGAFRPESSVREYLLFSDGLSNFGGEPFAKPAVPLFAISAAVKADPVFLTHIAERSGGRFIDLVQATVPEAAHKLLHTVTRVEVMTGNGISQPVLGSPYPQGGRVLLAGLLDEVSGTAQLTITPPGARAQRLDVPVTAGKSSSALPAAQWARLRVAELEAEYTFNRAEIRRLGQRFKLVTRETSLIVLDRVEDYARYEILPPAELRGEYERVLSGMAKQRADERRSHLENIVRRFEEKAAWWNRDFPKDDPVRIATKQKVEQIAVTAGNVEPRARQDAMQRMAAESTQREAGAAARLAPPAMNIPAAPMPAPAERRVAEDRILKAVSTGGAPLTATIQLQKWQPNEPYAARLRAADKADLYRIYLDEKTGYANSTAFYLDVADIFFDKGQDALAIRILTNLAEMDLENRHILRVLGYRLMQAKVPAQAIPVFKKVLELSPEEPQSYRDLGLAFAAAGQTQAAVDSLNEVVTRPWHNRFPDIELITLAELNAIIATSGKSLDTSRIDARLLKNLPLDLRAVLTWDADNTDIDLWVTDPNGEKAFYGHQLTYQGGRMSQDFTGGYGPEEFSLKTAKPGKYKVEAQYFGDRRQSVTGATTLSVRLSTRFGTADQQDQTVTLRLKDKRETILVGEFEIK